MRLFKWLKNVMEGQRLRRRVNSFSRELSRLDNDRKRCSRRLTAERKKLDSIRNEVVQSENRLREAIDEALSVQKRYEEQLEKANSKVRIYEEVTVPTLIQQNRVLLEMWKAETDIQVRRQVAYQHHNREEE